jgi:hypothetical protein
MIPLECCLAQALGGKEMRISILGALMLAMASFCAAATQSKAGERTIVGYISDGMCGLDHKAMNMGDDKECAARCAEGGARFAIADQAHKVVYLLDDAVQPKAREFAGQKVRVTGRLDSKARTITVSKIEPAK